MLNVNDNDDEANIYMIKSQDYIDKLILHWKTYDCINYEMMDTIRSPV